MHRTISLAVFVSILALAMPLGATSAEEALAEECELNPALGDDDPCLKQGLVRERAEKRAKAAEERRLEKEKEMEKRKGAGLDRDRAEERARKLEERRVQEEADKE